MTLILTIATPWGVWQSSDFRLSVRKNGKWVPHTLWSPKYVDLICADGRMRITYTGLGEVDYVGRRTINPIPDQPLEDQPQWLQNVVANEGRRLRGPTSAWLRSILAGEGHTVDSAIETIRSEASALPSFYDSRMPTMFLASIFHEGRFILADVRNVPARSRWFEQPIARSFEVGTFPIDKPIVFGLGATDAVSPAERRRLNRITAKPPRHHEDYIELLAQTNRRAARTSLGRAVISEACQVSYQPPEDAGGTTQLYTWDLEPPRHILETPLILHGIDLSGLSGEQHYSFVEAMKKAGLKRDPDRQRFLTRRRRRDARRQSRRVSKPVDEATPSP